MAKTFHPYLPPLRVRIASRFLIVVGLYAVFGLSMIAAVYLTSRMTPRLIHVNYDSIAAANQMGEAWSALLNPRLDPKGHREKWKKDFEGALQLEERNVTEQGEENITSQIQSLWKQVHLDKISKDQNLKMRTLLRKLIAVNEKGMFQIAEESSRMGQEVYWGGIIFLAVTLIFTAIISNGIANRLAYPLKAIAETLRSRPALGSKLKLPNPTSLELKILNHEMVQLWNNLGSLRQLNVEELNLQRNQLRTILMFVEDAILVLDPQGHVLHANPGIQRFITLSLEEIIGKQWADLSTTNENYIILRNILQTDLAQHQAIQLMVEGQKRSLSIRFRAIENERHEIIGKLFLFHDVTERRQTEKLRREFIGVLSHELKTPLQSLSICSELLAKHKNALPSEGQLLVDTINEDVSRIRAVANDFIQVGVENLSSLKLVMEQVYLDDALSHWLKPFMVLAHDKKINLVYESESKEKCLVKIDQVKFPWVISNILANALRIAPAKSLIRVVLKSSTDEAFVVISDEGPGISEDVQRRMFEPYFQAQNTGFLGIGLTIAKEVVEAHNGAIKFSPNIPHGAVFTVSLPRVHLAGVLS